jgi:hypothetical protein
MTRTGLDGYDCANAAQDAASDDVVAAPPISVMKSRRRI